MHFAPSVLGATLVVVAVVVLLAACSSEQPQEPIVSAMHFFERGNEAYADANYEGAIFNFKRAIKEHEPVAAFHYNLGLAYYKSGAFTEAVGAYQRALALEPDMPDAHLNLALSYDRLYDRQAAHTHYNRYVSMVAGRQPKADEEPSEAAARPVSAAQREKMAVQQQLEAEDPRAALNPQRVPKQPEAQQGQAQAQAQTQAQAQAQSQAGQRASGGNGGPSRSQGDSKWWTQDRFVPNQ